MIGGTPVCIIMQHDEISFKNFQRDCLKRIS
jgi:hypothetical protein